MQSERTSRPPARERSPLAELMVVAAPSIAAMMSYPLKQFVDAYMVSQIGVPELSAQGDGGIVAWVYIAACFGSLNVVSTFVSQHLGAGKPEKGAAYLWNGLFLAAVFAVPAMIAGLFGMELFGLFYEDPNRVALANTYYSVLMFGAFFPIAARTVGFYFYGMHRPSVVFVTSLVGASTNIGVNYLLIFGNWGFPELGLQGAAIATVIASAVEFTIPMLVFCSPRWARTYHVFRWWRPSWTTIKEIGRIGWPGGLMYCNEMACWAIFMAFIIGRMGPEHSAASWIALRYMTLSFQPTLGLQMAVSAVVGKHIGAGDRAAAEHRAWLGMKIGMIFMAACAVVFVVFREPLIAFFIEKAETPGDVDAILRIGGGVMICAAFFQLFDAMAIIMSGALRGAGDTVWPGVVTAILSWVFIIGVGLAIAMLRPEWGAVGPWIGAALFIMALGVVMVWRFAKGPWREIDLMNVPQVEVAMVAAAAEADPVDADALVKGPPA